MNRIKFYFLFQKVAKDDNKLPSSSIKSKSSVDLTTTTIDDHKGGFLFVVSISN